MGMVKRKQEVEDVPVQPAPLPPALPSLVPNDVACQSKELDQAYKVTRVPVPKEMAQTRGGVAHDAATITAAMSAMKTDEEVKALYTSLYRHILALVTE